MDFRFAICNELFQGWKLDQACAAIRADGYTGIEIAPFTMAEDATKLNAQERRAIRETFDKHELRFVGLHWILTSPPGLHATSPDRQLRQRTWEFLSGLVDLAADLKNNGNERPVLVFGSPKQRMTTGGTSRADATKLLVEGLAELAPHAEEQGVTVLLEALSPDQCDVVTSLDEAASIVKTIGSPAVQTMFDVHNAVEESEPASQLLHQYFPLIRHVHVNELDGKEPGTGDYDFRALLQTLSDLKYQGWISLEAFDFERDPRQIAQGSLRYLTELISSQSFAQTL